MKNLKIGSPLTGVAIGLALAGIAVLIMLIGFWKALLLLVLFGIGYFIGTVENKQDFIRRAANRIIPAKEAKMIDLKSEIAREQEEQSGTSPIPPEVEMLFKQKSAATEEKAEENEDGE
ncbi:MAG: DUF2273 domain-containing protein [Clostridia bacterium]|nr:DUF2273 domain-containing protein [Clostridia bacterium]